MFVLQEPMLIELVNVLVQTVDQDSNPTQIEPNVFLVMLDSFLQDLETVQDVQLEQYLFKGLVNVIHVAVVQNLLLIKLTVNSVLLDNSQAIMEIVNFVLLEPMLIELVSASVLHVVLVFNQMLMEQRVFHVLLVQIVLSLEVLVCLVKEDSSQ